MNPSIQARRRSALGLSFMLPMRIVGFASGCLGAFPESPMPSPGNGLPKLEEPDVLPSHTDAARRALSIFVELEAHVQRSIQANEAFWPAPEGQMFPHPW
ncbi:hypothetical protein DFH06DRAFT_1237954 [Mycena polygramma]|nr:hypothetical protein DFH06DRAFT_1237954 [Mycena polygramma]